MREFRGDFEVVMVGVVGWVGENEGEMMRREEGEKKGLRFYGEMKNERRFDMRMRVMVREGRVVSEVEGGVDVKNMGEGRGGEGVRGGMEVYMNGEVVRKWDE